MIVLGNNISDTLSWDPHVTKIVLPALRNRVHTLKNMTKYLKGGFRAQYTNSVFRSKLMFGIEAWGGASKTVLSKIQILQNKAAKLALSKDKYNLSTRQKQQLLNWHSIETEN